ncbi:MAG: DNA polymerase III subunit delta [Spiroplasma sp.]
MLVFYGLDIFLLTQAVNNYLKINYLDLGLPKDWDDNKSIVTYYLEPEYFDLTIERILKEASSLDLFNYKKIIIVNDYHLILNSNVKKFTEFVSTIEQFTTNIIVFKVLTNKLKAQVFSSKVKKIFVDSYNKEQLKKWILNTNSNYQIKFGQGALDALVSMFPNSLDIIKNELGKLQNLNQVVDIARIKNLSSKYFFHNPYKLIDSWLNKDYFTFWFQYRSYWEKINYDKLNLFSIAIYQLELIRNIKLLLAKNFSNQEIIKKMNISVVQLKNLSLIKLQVKEINHLLIKAHELDFWVKNGKIAKKLAIGLFFSKI